MSASGKPGALTPFLLAIARFHATGETASLATPSDPDWPDRVAAAGLIGLAISALRAHGEDVPEAARRLAVADASFRLRALADLRHLSASLDAEGIRWIILKGPLLTDHVYRHRGIRRYSDLDLLIHPADFERGLAVISDGHASLVDRNWKMINELDRGELVLLMRHGTVLDLHWHLINRAAARREVGLDVQHLFDDVRQIGIDDISIPAPSSIDTLLHVAMHAAHSGGHQVRWLLDVDQCVRALEGSAADVRNRAQQLGALPAVQVMTRRAARHIGADLTSFARSLGAGSAWTVVSGLADRATKLDVDAGRFTGRIIYSSTRRDTMTSARALGHNAKRAIRLGQHRRTTLVDRSLLQRAGGTPHDRAEWLRRITASASETSRAR